MHIKIDLSRKLELGGSGHGGQQLLSGEADTFEDHGEQVVEILCAPTEDSGVRRQHLARRLTSIQPPSS